jgi:hypothetical protein
LWPVPVPAGLRPAASRTTSFLEYRIGSPGSTRVRINPMITLR